MNSVSLIGRWVRDVKLRYTQSGKPVLSGVLAVNDGREEAAFVPVVVWGNTAEAVANHHGRKGQQVGVSGRLQSRSYTTHDGQKRTVIEVVAARVDFLGGQPQGQQAEEQPGDAVGTFDEPDDVPFD